MTVKVHMESGLTQAFGRKDVEILVPEETNVKGLLAGMIEIWGDSLSPHLFKPGSDQLLPYVRLMINGQTIQFINGMETVLNDGDEVLLLPLAAGG
jgi:molybdopterin converting factor small subunit